MNQKIFNTEKIREEIKFEREFINDLYTEDFRSSFSNYLYDRSELKNLQNPTFTKQLFELSEPEIGIYKIFDLKTFKKYPNSKNFFAIYDFNNIINHDVQTEICISLKKLPQKQYSDLFKTFEIKNFSIIDLEFFEKIPESSAFYPKGTTYYNKSGFLPDLDKLHLILAILHDRKDAIIPLYIGIGTNQPSDLSEAGIFSRDRFYRYDLLESREISAFIKRDTLTKRQVDKISLNDNSYYDIFLNKSVVFCSFKNRPRHKYEVLMNFDRSTSAIDYQEKNQKLFDALNAAASHKKFKYNLLDDFVIFDDVERYEGIYETKYKPYYSSYSVGGKNYRTFDGFEYLFQKGISELNIDYQNKRLDSTAEIQKFFKKDGLKEIEKLLFGLNNDFDKYLRIFHDPFRLLSKHGYINVLKHLIENGSIELWGQIGIQEIASDLYKSSFPDERRMRGIPLMFLHYYHSGRLEEMVVKTSKNRQYEVVPL